MGKFYAVKKGYTIGVFNNWGECSKQVKGYPGAIYKSFLSKIEAERFINSDFENICQKNIKNENKIPITKVFNNCNKKIIYTDGSCKKSIGGYAVVYNEEKTVTSQNLNNMEIYSGPVPYNPCTNNIAELYAIKKALEHYENNLTIMTDSEYSINVLTGVKNYTKNIELIDEIKSLLSNKNIDFVHVRSHVGIYENEICDQEAKKIVDEIYNKI